MSSDDAQDQDQNQDGADETPAAPAQDGRSADHETTPETDPAAGLRSALGKERERAKLADAARKESDKALKAAQAKLDEIEGKDRPAIERLTAERDRMAAERDEAARVAEDRAGQVRAVRAEQQVRDAAEAANARTPRLVYRLIRDDLDIDDDGTVANLDEAIKAAKKDAPELFRSARADGGARDETRDTSTIAPGMDRLRYGYEQAEQAKRRR